MIFSLSRSGKFLSYISHCITSGSILVVMVLVNFITGGSNILDTRRLAVESVYCGLMPFKYTLLLEIVNFSANMSISFAPEEGELYKIVISSFLRHALINASSISGLSFFNGEIFSNAIFKSVLLMPAEIFSKNFVIASKSSTSIDFVMLLNTFIKLFTCSSVILSSKGCFTSLYLEPSAFLPRTISQPSRSSELIYTLKVSIEIDSWINSFSIKYCFIS